MSATATSVVGAQTVPRLTVDARVLTSENPLLLSGDDDRGAVLMEVTARPGVSITTANGSTVDLGAVVTERGYSRRYGSVVIGSLTGRVEYRDSEYFSVLVTGAASRDLAVDLLTSSVDAPADPSGARNAYTGQLSLAVRPDEHLRITPSIGISKSDFTNASILRNTRAIDIGLAVANQFSERLRLGGRGAVVFNDVAGLTSANTQFLYATADYRLGAAWRATGELGVERSDARSATLLARVLLSGRGTLCYTAPEPTLCVNGSLNSEVSGVGGLQRRAVIGGSLHQRFGERTSLSVDAAYQRSFVQGDAFPPFDAIRTTALLERRIGRRVTVAAEVQYLRRRLVQGRRIGAGFAGVRLTYAVQRR